MKDNIDMTNRTESIEVRVTSNRKEQWKSYVEQSDKHESLSGLIRLAVHQKVNNQDQSAIQSTDGGLPDITAQLDEYNETLQQDIDKLEQLLTDEVSLGDLDQLVDDLVSQLVEAPDAATFRELSVIRSNSTDIRARIEGTPSSLAHVLGVSKARMRRALARADEQHRDVQWIQSEWGEKRYYRQTPDPEPFLKETIDPDNVEGFCTGDELLDKQSVY
jgi:hypothetical protein